MAEAVAKTKKLSGSKGKKEKIKASRKKTLLLLTMVMGAQ